jgi:beta-glucosidase-like glycosyl hydrolase
MHRNSILLLTLVVNIYAQKPSFPDCNAGPLAAFPICDHILPSRQRATDLIGRMTTTEKISQIIVFAAAIPRLGIPSFNWWHEALHGVSLVLIMGVIYLQLLVFPCLSILVQHSI